MSHASMPGAAVALIAVLMPCLAAAQPPARYGDRPARPVPEWMKRTVIYQIWLRGYGPRDNFRNAEQRLEAIAKLGATMIQLSPIHPHPFGPAPHGSPYSVDDYYGVHPDYGGEEGLRRFIDRAHQLGLKVILDMVFYHSSFRCNLLDQHPDMFMRDAQGKVVLGRWTQPRLDTTKPATRKYLIENLTHWVKNFGADGFRADVAGGLPAAREFWEEAHDALDKVRPELFLLAEANNPELTLRGFDASYGFTYMAALQAVLRGDSPASALRQTWEQDRDRFPQGALLLRAVDNHDQRRAITELGSKACLAAAAINLTLDGVPFIYNGQEIGDPNPISVNLDFPIRWDSQRYVRQTLPVYTSLIAIRKEHPALAGSELRWVPNSDEDRIVSYARGRGEGEILVVVNTRNHPWTGTVEMPAGEYALRDLATGRSLKVFPPKPALYLSLAPFEYLIATRSSKEN